MRESCLASPSDGGIVVVVALVALLWCLLLVFCTGVFLSCVTCGSCLASPCCGGSGWSLVALWLPCGGVYYWCFVLVFFSCVVT